MVENVALSSSPSIAHNPSTVKKHTLEDIKVNDNEEDTEALFLNNDVREENVFIDQDYNYDDKNTIMSEVFLLLEKREYYR
eukprot:8821423-Ditylum_brightwellii.AAC.1